MRVQYTGHVIQTETHDQHTALKLTGGLVTYYGLINRKFSPLAFTLFHFSKTLPSKPRNLECLKNGPHNDAYF